MDKRCAKALKQYNNDFIPGNCQDSSVEETHECFKSCFGYDKANGGCFQHTFIKPILLKQGFLSIQVEDKQLEWYAKLGYGNQEELVRMMTKTAYDSDGQACQDCSMWTGTACAMLDWMQTSGEENVLRWVKVREGKTSEVKTSIDRQINNLSIAVEMIKNYKEFMTDQGQNNQIIKETKISEFIKKPTVPGFTPMAVEAIQPITVGEVVDEEQDSTCGNCGCHYNSEQDRYIRVGIEHICHDCMCRAIINEPEDEGDSDEG